MKWMASVFFLFCFVFVFFCLFFVFSTPYRTEMKRKIDNFFVLLIACSTFLIPNTDWFFFFLKMLKMLLLGQLQLHIPETKDKQIFSFAFQMADKRNTRILINIWSKNLSFFPPLRSLSGSAQQVLLHF